MVFGQREVMAGVEQALPGQQIVAVALAVPPGTEATQLAGLAAGGALGGIAGNWNGANFGSALGGLAANLELNHESSAPAYILALTDGDIYVLGKHNVALFGSNKNLSHVATIPLQGLKVTHQRRGIVTEVTFTDTQTGQTIAVECKPLGTGIEEFLQALQSEEAQIDG